MVKPFIMKSTFFFFGKFYLNHKSRSLLDDEIGKLEYNAMCNLLGNKAVKL
jgi:hypothetical protein